MNPAAKVGKGAHWRSIAGLIAVVFLGLPSEIRVAADELAPASIGETAPAINRDDVRFRFAFSGAPWREVLNWLAEESGLALHVGNLPVGTFTYTDPESFTIDQAISRVNLFLIPQGYGVVKRGQLLSVISLADPRSLQQLDALATPTTVNELVNRSEHEIVKCMVPLGTTVAAEAVAELQPLMLMTAPVILPKSNQLIVTETAGKVRSVLAVLEALNVPREQSVVRRFDLESVDVAAVMAVAGPHIGLPTGQTEGLDISISMDATGKSLFATGAPDKVAKLEALIKVLDIKTVAAETPLNMSLRSHTITGDNLQAVFEVLQTILEGKAIRLSMQPSTKSIVALADPESHAVIESTIAEMQAPAIDFAVIELNALDPYFVLGLIEEMFGAPKPPARDRDGRSIEVVQAPAPKVDADPGNRRLFVRGSTEQIDQIRKMVANLMPQKQAAGISTDSVRVLPLKGQQAQRVLEAAGRVWQGANRVLILPSADSMEDPNRPIERVLHPQESGERPVALPAKPSSQNGEAFQDEEVSYHRASVKSEALVSFAGEAGPSATNATAAAAKPNPIASIRGQLVPQGILLQSEDTAALDLFQEQLLEIAASNNRTASPPVVYYLKYVNAEDAVKMLADLLDGGQSLAEVPGNTLINGSTSSLGTSGYYGSFTTKKEGIITVTAGTATIVSDARLNRLIVQGTTEDVAIIDEYMQIVDKGSSLTTIETFGRSHVIELQYTKAKDVADMIKQAFVNRIANSPQANPQQGRPGERSGERPGNEARNGGDNNDRREGGEPARDVAETPTRGRLPEMTVAAHEASNTLVITAPDALFAEVEALVRSVDTRSEQVVEVIPAKDGVDLESILRRLNGEQVRDSREDRRRSNENEPRGNSDRSRSR